MNEEESRELTVYYPQNFCKFIFYTTFTDDTRSFVLTTPNDKNAVDQHSFTILKTCQDYMSEQHNQLLKVYPFCCCHFPSNIRFVLPFFMMEDDALSLHAYSGDEDFVDISEPELETKDPDLSGPAPSNKTNSPPPQFECTKSFTT
ncbi:hypothetical protein CEXT_348471 [Caerostris extrusa]|uniref:Uncharacterized protein n=1 Tax=Caerostris extrusa TaxID=172846 RepID=A0AAV4TX22_CAEEX|nr:hypothetical protein CEXT_348471 [Caerostris extrusa]